MKSTSTEVSIYSNESQLDMTRHDTNTFMFRLGDGSMEQDESLDWAGVWATFEY